MAPEVIQMQQPPTPKSDIWSVGCLTLELLTGKPPYFNLTGMSALYHICEDAEIPIDDPQHVLTPDCLRFIRECFQKDPARRKSSAQLLAMPWFAAQQGLQKSRIVLESATERRSRGDSRSSGVSSNASVKFEVGGHEIGRSSSLSKESEGILDGLDFSDMEEDFSATVKALEKTQTMAGRSPRRFGGGEERIENVIESKIVMSMGIVDEITKKEEKIRAESVKSVESVLETLLECCKNPKNSIVIVKENGLFPLLTLIRMNLQNEKICLLGMKVGDASQLLCVDYSFCRCR